MDAALGLGVVRDLGSARGLHDDRRRHAGVDERQAAVPVTHPAREARGNHRAPPHEYQSTGGSRVVWTDASVYVTSLSPVDTVATPHRRQAAGLTDGAKGHT